MEWNPVVWVRDGDQFRKEVVAEFRKVTWPSQKEMVPPTGPLLVGEMENLLTTAQLAADSLVDLANDLRFTPSETLAK